MTTIEIGLYVAFILIVALIFAVLILSDRIRVVESRLDDIERRDLNKVLNKFEEALHMDDNELHG